MKREGEDVMTTKNGNRKSEVGNRARLRPFPDFRLPISYFLLCIAYFLLPSRALGAVQVETGTFVANTGSATTTVTTGFQGKAVFLWSDGKTAEGEVSGGSFNTAISDGTNGFSLSWAGDDAVSTTNV